MSGAAASVGIETDASVSVACLDAAPRLQAAPPAADVGNEHTRNSRRSARANAPVHSNQEAGTAAVGTLGQEGDVQGETKKRAVRGKSEGKAKRRKAAPILDSGAEADEVTATARAAAKGAVKRRKPREDITVDVVELLEVSVEEEEAEVAAPVKQKKGRRKAPAAAAGGNEEGSPPKAKQKRSRKKSAAPTDEPAAEGEDVEGEPAPKPKRVRKKAAPAEDDESAVLVDLPTTLPAGKLVGCHVSAAAGVERALVNAVAVGEPPLYFTLDS